MIRSATMTAALALLALPTLAEEKPVDPYTVSNANAGATPLAETRTFAAFHGKAGLGRIVNDTIQLSVDSPRTAEIFKAIDRERLQRTLVEQLCFVLNGGCDYTGRDMAASHKDMGLTSADMGALVEHLQTAMDKEGVPFSAQNRLLAKLAPMKRTVVER